MILEGKLILVTVHSWPVRQKISHFVSAKICDKYKVSLPKVDIHG